MGLNYDVYVGLEIFLITVNLFVMFFVGILALKGIVKVKPDKILIFPGTLYAGGLTFVAVFLYEVTTTCDESLDCYPFNVTKHGFEKRLPLHKHTITNCSEYLDMDNVVVDCYTFVLQYAEALGAAGGVMAIAYQVFGAIPHYTEWLDTTKRPKTYKAITVTIYLTTVGVLYILLLTVPALFRIFFRKRNEIWIHSAYLSAAVLPVVLIIMFGKKIKEIKNYDADADD